MPDVGSQPPRPRRFKWPPPHGVSVVPYRWHVTLNSTFHLPQWPFRNGYVPDVLLLIVSTPTSVVLCFRGADPFSQMSRQADVPMARCRQPGGASHKLV